MHEFNAIIEINDWSGIITLSQTTFDNINSCGSIIRNYYKFIDPTDYAKNFNPINTVFSNKAVYSRGLTAQ